MGRPPENNTNPLDWNEIASSFVFSSPRAMLVHWYYLSGLAWTQILELLSSFSVRDEDLRLIFNRLDLPLHDRDKQAKGGDTD